MCITLDKDQSPIGVFFFENQTDLLQSSESSESEGEGESKLCKSNSGYKIDNDEDSDKKEKRKTEKLDEAPKAPSYEIKPSGQVTPRSYVVDPKVVVVNVKTNTLKTKSIYTIFKYNIVQKVGYGAEGSEIRDNELQNKEDPH